MWATVIALLFALLGVGNTQGELKKNLFGLCLVVVVLISLINLSLNSTSLITKLRNLNHSLNMYYCNFDSLYLFLSETLTPSTSRDTIRIHEERGNFQRTCSYSG